MPTAPSAGPGGDNATKMITDIFNAALMVITPFVPFLGELMLAYTVYQLSSEIIEGVVGPGRGPISRSRRTCGERDQRSGATGHVAAGAAVGGALRRSLFVDDLRVVEVNGQPRLWNPDLAPYARHDLQLPADAQPDALGLHERQNQRILRLKDRHYVVAHEAASDTYRIQHPTRPRPIPRDSNTMTTAPGCMKEKTRAPGTARRCTSALVLFWWKASLPRNGHKPAPPAELTTAPCA